MYPIPAVKIDDRIPPDRKDEAIEIAKDMARWFFVFDDEVWQLCLHEAGHVLALRTVGFEPKVFGPKVVFRAGELWPVFAHVEQAPDSLLLTVNPVKVAKVFISPNVILKQLTNAPTEKLNEWTSRDYEQCFDWFKRKGQSEETFCNLLAEAEKEVLSDLQSADFRSRLEQTAEAFRAKVLV